MVPRDLETIRRHLSELVGPLLSREGVELVAIEFHPQGGRHVVRFLLDTPRGITVAECARMNGAIGRLLDDHTEFDLGPYLLEVASPGLDRPLRTTQDFLRSVGRAVDLELRGGERDACRRSGTVVWATDEWVRVKTAYGEVQEIPRQTIRTAVLQVKFSK